jgi:hypothetical protein
MKAVINKCHGGFNLSPKAIKKYCELKGMPCFLFSYDYAQNKHVLIDEEKAEQLGFWVAYKVENPDELINFVHPEEQPPEGLFGDGLEQWNAFQLSKAVEATIQNNENLKNSVIAPGNNRAEIELIQTVEELGLEASGNFSNLVVIEIPDDIEWFVVSSGGKEHIAEKHRIWE